MSQLSKDEKHSIITALLIGVFGYIVSMLTCDDIFPRFGAVIACVGIYFATRGFTLKMDSFEPIAEEMRKKTVEDCLQLLESRRGSIPDNQFEESKTLFLHKAKEAEYAARRKVYRLKLRLLRVESSIVIAGTLIWAFGDWTVYSRYMVCTQ